MPNYAYRCEGGHWFDSIRTINGRHDAQCPECKQPALLQISAPSVRFAEPLTVLQDLGTGNGHHKGFQKIGWIADSGKCPPPGQPYKTAKEVQKEEHGGLKEV